MAVFRMIPAGDLAIVDHQLVLVSGVALVRQKLCSRFRFFLGEWFLDRRLGLPFYRDVFVKNPNIPLIRSLFRRVAIETPGVLSLRRFDVTFDFETRELSLHFEAICDGDERLIVLPTDRDFILANAA